MPEAPDRQHSGIRKWINANTLGLAVLLVAISVSVVRVMSIQKELFDPDKTIIRISHWQLELGYRDAMQSAIDEYERLHPGVEILQQPMTEIIYGQWLNIQLISGTAPDIAETGDARMSVEQQYILRFFLPLTELISKPNPYNRGTPLEKLPWRETFIDGMRGGYQPALADYFAAPTCMSTRRLFYNKDLLRKATGSDTPPQTFAELLVACDTIRDYGRRQGNTKMVPIACSRYYLPEFLDRYLVPFTAGFEPELDTDMDGGISLRESYAAFCKGQVSMQTPAIKAYYECVKTLCDNFPEGYLSLGREMEAFLFVQGNAGMIASGSFDALSLFGQAKFEVGVIDFPLPGKNERWGEHIAGRVNEAGITAGAAYGVYKFSKNKEIAIDFLQFLTSRKCNEVFNRKAEWLPVAIGAKTSDRMAPFMPNPRGFSSYVSFFYGNYATIILEGARDRFLGGELDDYNEFAAKVEEALKNEKVGGDKAWAIEYDEKRRWCRNQERVLAVQATRMLMDSEATDAPSKYRQAFIQQLQANNGQEIRHRFEQVRKKPIPKI